MVSGRVLKRRIQRQLQEESRPRSRPPTRQAGDRFGLTALQQQVGNRAVQQLLAQRQAEMKKTEKPEELVETGQLKIEKPVIEEYEVNGNSLNEISRQLLSPEKWYEYEYQYKPKVENGQVTQVDITIIPTIRMPRWVGGWNQASAENKVAWLKMLKMLVGEGEKYEDMLQLLRQWLGINFEQAPPKVKGPWQGMLQERQSQEKSYMDILQRRALVLQQKMLNQPAEQLKPIFDLFQQKLKIEEAAYAQQRKFGQEQQITLSVNEMVL